jgi:hypothetical protein
MFINGLWLTSVVVGSGDVVLAQSHVGDAAVGPVGEAVSGRDEVTRGNQRGATDHNEAVAAAVSRSTENTRPRPCPHRRLRASYDPQSKGGRAASRRRGRGRCRGGRGRCRRSSRSRTAATIAAAATIASAEFVLGATKGVVEAVEAAGTADGPPKVSNNSPGDAASSDSAHRAGALRLRDERALSVVASRGHTPIALNPRGHATVEAGEDAVAGGGRRVLAQNGG